MCKVRGLGFKGSGCGVSANPIHDMGSPASVSGFQGASSTGSTVRIGGRMNQD